MQRDPAVFHVEQTQRARVPGRLKGPSIYGGQYDLPIHAQLLANTCTVRRIELGRQVIHQIKRLSRAAFLD